MSLVSSLLSLIGTSTAAEREVSRLTLALAKSEQRAEVQRNIALQTALRLQDLQSELERSRAATDRVPYSSLTTISEVLSERLDSWGICVSKSLREEIAADILEALNKEADQ